MQARAFNPQIFIEVLCYSVFAWLIFHLVNSGKYLSYVTPRMEPYLYFTAIVMLIYAAAGLGRMFRPQYKVRAAHCFVLAIPILFMVLPHNPISTADLSGRYIGGNPFSNSLGQNTYSTADQQGSGFNTTTNEPEKSGVDPVGNPSPVIENDLSSIDAAPAEDTVPIEDNVSDVADAAIPDIPEVTAEGEYASGLPGLDLKNKKITVANDDFGVWISEIYENMEKYEGFQIKMTGFVFKDPEIFAKNEFVPARLMMACCAADLAPVGFLCKYDKASELKTDSWVTVEGKLFMGKYTDGDAEYNDPQISVTKVVSAEEVEGYVYPY